MDRDTLRKRFSDLTNLSILQGGVTIGTAEDRYIRLAMKNDLGFERQQVCVDHGWNVRYIKNGVLPEWSAIRFEDNSIDAEYRVAIEALATEAAAPGDPAGE